LGRATVRRRTAEEQSAGSSFESEAIESAFAQRFSPMEIILSDDCSTDRTFAIMALTKTAEGGRNQLPLLDFLSGSCH